MCTACDYLLADVRSTDDEDWSALVDRTRAAVVVGDLEAIDGPPLEAEASGPAPSRRVFQCPLCAQLFLLERGGCHVLGDGWRPLHGN